MDPKEPQSEKKIILIAEDEPINFMLLQKMLEKCERKVIWAKNGQEAVQIATSNPQVGIILMDIRMPIMDGITATQTIRKTLKELPIIALTAYTLSNEREKCTEAGTTAFLTKPVRPNELLPLIEELISC